MWRPSKTHGTEPHPLCPVAGCEALSGAAPCQALSQPALYQSCNRLLGKLPSLQICRTAISTAARDLVEYPLPCRLYSVTRCYMQASNLCRSHAGQGVVRSDRLWSGQ